MNLIKQELATVTVAQVDPNTPATNKENNGIESLLYGGLPIALSIFGAFLLVWFIKSFLCICKPNEILILSGRKWRTKDGQEMGYRVLLGGRAIRIPIVETVKRMDVTTMPVRVEVRNAYAKGGTPLNIQAIANVKISSDPVVVGNAIERFLDRDRSELARVSRETLEGYLRGVVATLTPEELNEDRLSFAQRIASDVSRDLSKLGLQLDTLKIQSVSDDVDYLKSWGRKQIALVIRDAEIAESNALTQAEQIEAQSEEYAQVAKTQDKIIVLEKENELRTIKAQLEQRAKSEEEITTAAAQEKKAKAEQVLQVLRAELERLRLQADEVLPAEARRQAQELRAKGEAAFLEENAKAAALVNDILSQVWQQTGSDASKLFLIQQIETVLQEAVQIPQRIHLEKVNVIDNGDGKSVASLVNIYPEIVLQFLENVNRTLGIDVTGTLGTGD
ncbi:Band 7 protein [Trichormus variabilis ATCC 29413]|uniref:Band 7 protein n=2 Tax=Anabaena variabilis TaxID=264691 RepID=Q3MDB6_TRIV2|nr:MULTISPECIES: flotillin family protein [Nostocaceae]ABA21020.1 Band 7 protein [Trichormus variabilis ATCC 29413]MBC1214170.1 flotillin family protein [Trichormus variabilis ARAD]MBC1256031.1 flotillin family protein [Trichormus variabilis V5]MBC1269228.1 flotillin family protein [Trichormus variabilis FSR]MBC1300657.1 flotillin family protein [Trichormus variabilis N2B]